MIHRCKNSDFLKRVVIEFALNFRILLKKKRNEKGELVITKSFSKSSNFRALSQHS